MGAVGRVPWLAYFHFMPVWVSDTGNGGGVLIEYAVVSESASWNKSSSSAVLSIELQFEPWCDRTALVGRDVYPGGGLPGSDASDVALEVVIGLDVFRISLRARRMDGSVGMRSCTIAGKTVYSMEGFFSSTSMVVAASKNSSAGPCSAFISAF